MKRSIAQRTLLVFVLVTLIDGGIVSESAMTRTILSSSQATQQENAAPVSNTGSDTASYWQQYRSSDCPYHRNTPARKSTLAGVMPD